MSNELLIGIVMLCICGVLFLAGYFANAPRAKRWKGRIQAAGTIQCGKCHQAGTLCARTTSSGYASSSNMVLACSACGSHDWQVVQ
jgi:hypothetical protein